MNWRSDIQYIIYLCVICILQKYWIHNVHWYVGSGMYILWNDCWTTSFSRTRTQRSIRTNFQNSRFAKKDFHTPGPSLETSSIKNVQVHQIIETGQLFWMILHLNRKVFLKWNQSWKIILVKIGQWRHLDLTFMVAIYFLLYYDITIALEYLLGVQWNIMYLRYVDVLL